MQNTDNTKDIAVNTSDKTSQTEASVQMPPEITIPRKSASFSERMGDAGYLAGRRYDSVKNAFLSYRTTGNKPKGVTPRITRSGETFSARRKILGKLCLVGGYLRLFLALDPKEYNQEKYHHKDYTEVLRYAKFPFMIKLSSDRQVKYAEELIEELMLKNGFEKNPDYIIRDQASIFKKTRRKGAANINEQFTPVMPTPVVLEDKTSEIEQDDAEFGEPEEIDVKLPRRATIVDRRGERIGKIRNCVWQDEDGTERGTFVKEDTNVFFYEGGKKSAYVDKNDNILTSSNKYIATIRRFERMFIVPVIIAALLLTALTGAICIYFLKNSGNTDYAPVIFIATEKGNSWEDYEDLPVFYNERFGDTVVAPGMKGSYRFTFENRNPDTLTYSLSFSEENQYGIGMLYRLKRDGAYISGVSDYVSAGELSIDGLTIEAESSSVFELEWFWADNDASDTAAGENNASYTLKISLSAQVADSE